MKIFNGMLVFGLSVVALSFSACVPIADDDDDATEGGNDFTALYDGYFQECASCHAPDAPGHTSSIEQTLDFTDVDTAYSTISSGQASGLTGRL